MVASGRDDGPRKLNCLVNRLIDCVISDGCRVPQFCAAT
jgi:hypothetical protein